MTYANDSSCALYACENHRTGNYGEELNIYNESENEIAYTRYAVEINDDDGFVKQIDVFSTYEEAEKFYMDYDDSQLNDDEYLNIIFIDYDKYDNEINFGTVC